MGNFGPTEILIVLVLLFLFFGASRLPGMSRKAGRHMRASKEAVATAKDEFAGGMREIDAVAPIKATMRDADSRVAQVKKPG